MVQPIVLSVQTPVQPRQIALVTGTYFGFVEAVFLNPVGGGDPWPASYIQVTDGEHVNITIPPDIPTNADYQVELVTIEDEASNPTSFSLLHVEPLTGYPSPPVPSNTPDPLPLPVVGDSVGLDRLRMLTRLELGDRPSAFQAQMLADGLTTFYDLPERHIGSISVAAVPPGSPDTNSYVLDPATYTLDEYNGTLLFDSPPGKGYTIFVSGSRYQFFSADDLDVFIQIAFAQITKSRTITTVGISPYGYRTYAETPYTFDTLPDVEYLPTALLAAIEALWTILTDASYEIDISADGASIPRSERYRQLQQQIALLKARYQELAQLLNIGLSRIEQGTLRRVSRQTGRLVPVYVDKEYDDHSLPVRVLPGIDHGTDEGTEFIDPYFSGGSGYGSGF